MSHIDSSSSPKNEKESADQCSHPANNDKSSFKFDMPDIDFSSPPKKLSNENKSDGQKSKQVKTKQTRDIQFKRVTFKRLSSIQFSFI